MWPSIDTWNGQDGDPSREVSIVSWYSGHVRFEYDFTSITSIFVFIKGSSLLVFPSTLLFWFRRRWHLGSYVLGSASIAKLWASPIPSNRPLCFDDRRLCQENWALPKERRIDGFLSLSDYDFGYVGMKFSFAVNWKSSRAEHDVRGRGFAPAKT